MASPVRRAPKPSGVTGSCFGLGFENETVTDPACFGRRPIYTGVTGVGAERDESIAAWALRLIALAHVRHLLPETGFAAAAPNPDLFAHAASLGIDDLTPC